MILLINVISNVYLCVILKFYCCIENEIISVESSIFKVYLWIEWCLRYDYL